MRTAQRMLVLIALLATALAAGAPSARATASTAAASLVGPSGICSIPSPSATRTGRAVLATVVAPPTPSGFRDIEITVAVNAAAPNHLYQVWLGDVFTSGGVPIGCAANAAGTFTTTGQGVGTFRGSVLRHTGLRIFQVFVSPDGFGSPSGFVTPLIEFTVP